MVLTVFARLVGGASLVILLLITIAYTGLNSVRKIEGGLVDVTDKATPMLIAGAESISALLKASLELNRFKESEVEAELNQQEESFNKLIEKSAASSHQLMQSGKHYAEILELLEASNKNINQFTKLAPQLFSKHRETINISKGLEEKMQEFVEMGDDLDSLLLDFVDEFKGEQTETLARSLSGMVSEAMVLVNDTAFINDLELVNSAINDINRLVADFDKKLAQLVTDPQAKDSGDYNQLISLLNKFKASIYGEGSILAEVQKKLQYKLDVKKYLADADAHVASAQEHLNNVFVKVKDLTQSVKQAASDDVSSSRAMLLIFAAIAILVAVFISLWVLRSITNPLNEILRVIHKVSDGDLTSKAKVYREDELGKLSIGFNSLVNALREMLKEIGGSAMQLSTAAEETSHISAKSNESVSEQKEQTDMIATAMNQMTATVDEVANRANSTLLEVQKANKETVDGQSIVQDSINTINTLADEIDRACAVIDKLDEYSTTIGAVLDVIRGIADQTNLLALNAAIEAARAGDQGRGFAVVADEVRTLASKTQDSTAEIQEMIEGLQSGTREAVAAMRESQSEAKNSVEKTEAAGETLRKITHAVDVINDMSSHIASAAEEQSSVSRDMYHNVTRISEMADTTAQGAKENMASSSELAELAEHMQELVSKFKV